MHTVNAFEMSLHAYSQLLSVLCFSFQHVQMAVTQNQMSSDSATGGGADGEQSAGTVDSPSGIGQLIDVSLPDTNGKPVNPFTDEALNLEGKSSTEVSTLADCASSLL